MSDSDYPMDLSVPPLQRAEKEREEKSEKVDLEDLAREIYVLLKASLREENDRVGRI